MAARRIVIVEDDPKLIEVFRMIFSKSGYKVFISDTGENALELVKKNKPDVILLDLILPDIQGDKILQDIKEYNPNIPIVICSATSDINLSVATMKYGAYDYIMKPFDAKKLLKMVKKAISEPKLEISMGKFWRRFERRDEDDRRKVLENVNKDNRDGFDRRKDYLDNPEISTRSLPLWGILGLIVIIFVILFFIFL